MLVNHIIILGFLDNQVLREGEVHFFPGEIDWKVIKEMNLVVDDKFGFPCIEITVAPEKEPRQTETFKIRNPAFIEF